MPRRVLKVISLEQFAEIRRRWPKIDGAKVDSAAAAYVHYLANPLPSAALQMELLRDVEERAERLRANCQTPTEVLEYLLWEGATAAGLPDARQQAACALSNLLKIIAASIEHLKREPVEYRGGHYAILFNDLRDVVIAGGYRANRSTKGPFLNIFQMVLDAIGDNADANNVVNYQLRLEKSRLKN
jgi:hypothetical protein